MTDLTPNLTSDNLLTAAVDVNDTAAPATQDPAKPDLVPDKFWDADKKEIRVDALLNSYLALERRASKMVPLPETDDDRKRLQKIMGLPDTADQYDITLHNDVIAIDPELNARLHQKGFTNDQVQEIYDLATEKLVPMILDMAAEFQADRELERLVKEFGGPEKWDVVSKQLQEFGQKNLPASAYDGLCCSYDGVMALYAMMKSGAKSPIAKDETTAIGPMDEAGLKQMMQNPKYWRERDPAFIARVSDGFQKLYGGR